MKIPDSTWYGKHHTRVEDILGYALCTQCRNCALNRLGQIEDDGIWYCFWKKAWLRGDDILTYRCRGFAMKSCIFCRKHRYCKEDATRIAWCNNYCDNMYHTPVRYYAGRPKNSIGRLKDPVAKQMEKDFMAWRSRRIREADSAGKELRDPEWWEKAASHHQADGSSPEGEHKEDQGGAGGL